MEKSDLVGIAIGAFGVLWGLVQTFAKKYADRQDNDLKGLSEKHADLYEKLIETQKLNTVMQQQNSESNNRLSASIDRLTQTVSHLETRQDERYHAINSRIDDAHESDELMRKRMHWIMNKLTVIKFALEKVGPKLTGDWESP